MSHIVEALPPKIEEQLRHQLPALPADQVCIVAEAYRDLRDSRRQALAPKDQHEAFKQTFGQLYSSLSAMASKLENMPLQLAEIIEAADALDGGRQSTRGMIEDLHRHLARAKLLLPQVQNGRNGTSREWLILRLAEIVECSGGIADTRPTGPLCVVTGIILQGLGESAPRLPVIVSGALSKRL